MITKECMIVVTGAGGQLGRELALMKPANTGIIGLDRSQLDITDAAQCFVVLRALKPDIVIHAAAYTAVDRAEAEPDAAWLVNVEGTRNVAVATESIGAKLIYVSTDYVFRGSGVAPYSEQETTDPQTVYGRTKLEGENVATAHCSRLFIVRTSWVYGQYGSNFVQTMLQLSEQRRELKIVNDQIGSPTYTVDLAEFLISLARTEAYGIYHASNSGQCTWYEFAKAIFKTVGVSGVAITPCTTAEFPRPALRPSYSVLGNEAMIAAGFEPLRHWHEALQEFLVNK